jgi:ribosomal-protein-alanine N-acetyltransferase
MTAIMSNQPHDCNALKRMRYAVRPMTAQDVAQVSSLERIVFPEITPPTSFARELGNRMARYLVAVETAKTPPAPQQQAQEPSLLHRLLRRLKPEQAPTATEAARIVGYVGVWNIAGEAHIVSIGVLPELRRQGIGELLLISAIEHAQRSNMGVVTLEVRVSNLAAQQLYGKYGFSVVGRRARYYSHNNEDAYIMTTQPINTQEFGANIGQLTAAHARRWGASDRKLHPV